MEWAVSIENVTKAFPGTDSRPVVALRDIELNIQPSTFTVIAGPNGSGKSVLMLLTAGLMKPTKGKITTSSKPGLVFQDASSQILGETPLEDVAFSLRNIKTPKKDIPCKASEFLSATSLEEKKDIECTSLSGGERRRLAVSSILALERDIMIFDEPYANLDYPCILQVNQLLEKLKEQKKTIIVLTHELEKCLALADHFVVLNKGEKVFDGNPQDGLKLDLTSWGIKNPLCRYENLCDLEWK